MPSVKELAVLFSAPRGTLDADGVAGSPERFLRLQSRLSTSAEPSSAAQEVIYDREGRTHRDSPKSEISKESARLLGDEGNVDHEGLEVLEMNEIQGNQGVLSHIDKISFRRNQVQLTLIVNYRHSARSHFLLRFAYPYSSHCHLCPRRCPSVSP